MAFKDYIIYTHHDASLTTIGAFLDNLGLSIAKNMTAEELVNYGVFGEGDEIIQNFTRITSMYDSTDRETFLPNGARNFSRPIETYPLYIGTRLALPKSQLFPEVALIAGYDQVEPIESLDNFMAENLRRLLSDPEYYPAAKEDLGEGQGVLNTLYPNARVWVWCRSLSPEDADYIPIESRNSLPRTDESFYERRRKLVRHFGIDGNIIDITPFIFSLQTSVDGGGGIFSMSLAPIEGERDKSTGWRPSSKTIQSINSREFTAQAKLNKYNEDDENIERSKFLLHNIIQPNDVVFIRFERLEGEVDRADPAEEYEYIVSKDILAKKSYDMIGLIDSNTIEASSQNQVNVEISVQGRDLMKLIQEDGSYFYPLAYTNYSESEFGDQKLLRRLTVTGKYPLFGEYAYRSIQYSIEFMINQVSNISIVPDNLFTSYGDRVSKTLQLDAESEDQVRERLKTLKREIEGHIAASRIQDGLTLEDKRAERAQITTAFQTIYAFISDVYTQRSILYNRQSFVASTWKAGTYAGQPVDQNSYPTSWFGLLFQNLQQTNQTFEVTDNQGNESVINVAATANTRADQSFRTMFQYVLLQKRNVIAYEPLPLPGIWQIVKLAFDPQIDNLRISDPSIAQPDGALIGQFNKICQEPFVEFYGDTYGDFYYFVFRRPPWNQQAIRRTASNFYQSQNFYTPTVQQANADEGDRAESLLEGSVDIIGRSGGRRASAVIDIFEEDVLSDSLSFYDGEVYSFYEIAPQAGFLGQGSEVSTGYIPIVQIPEYAEIWGSKRLRVVDQYTRFDGQWRLDNLIKTNIIQQAGENLKWLVETNAYMPFTRQGRITMNGDRRIKRGMWVRYMPTQELFYVTSVSQSISITSQIDRTTTITVERGMVEEFIQGKEVENAAGEGFTAGYFNIVDSRSIPQFVESFITDQATAGLIMSTFVDKKVLNFFLKRNQFKKNITTEVED